MFVFAVFSVTLAFSLVVGRKDEEHHQNVLENFLNYLGKIATDAKFSHYLVESHT